MDVEKVLATNVKLLRRQADLTQVALADEVRALGVPMNESAIVRIEQATRSVKVDELLALAVALRTTPADLLAHPYAATTTIGRLELDGRQMVDWCAGNPDAPHRRSTRNLRDAMEDRRAKRFLGDVVEAIELLADAVVDDQDRRTNMWAIAFAATHAQASLAALIQLIIPKDEVDLISQKFGLAERGF